MRLLRALFAVVLACAVTAGCTAVPDSSAPQTVEPIDLERGGSAAAPPRDVSARVIVSDFLDANADDQTSHASARAYLTSAARNQWSDQRTTIIARRQVPDVDTATGILQVTGHVVGTINADGVYQPSGQGIGNGGPTSVFRFKMVKVKGQWRIDQLRSGLLITDDQFRSYYTQRQLYFYDLADKHLVGDTRWTAIQSTTDPAPLATWLVGRLASGPRTELQDAVSTDTFPTQANPDRVLAREDAGTLSVEIPGAAQLDSGVRDRLAMQVARTLEDVAAGSPIRITDGGTPVRINAADGTSFTPASFEPPPVLDQSPSLYYLYQGHIRTAGGSPLSGPLGSNYYFTSFALTHAYDGAPLSVAAVEPTGSAKPHDRLYFGSQIGELQATKVQGDLTRPTWAPGRSEIWIGADATLHRVVVKGGTATDSTVQLPPTVAAGRIRSVRLSPDGQQVALVVANPSGSVSQLYVGAVVRDTSGVRVSGLSPISPDGVRVLDADWNTSQRLTAVGSLVSSGDSEVFDTYADGAFWEDRGVEGLPAQPVNVTASPAGVWVEASGQIWKQTDSGFRSTASSQQQFGTVPVYAS